MPSPAIIIFPQNPKTGNGWKKVVDPEEPICSDKSGDDFIQCTEGKSYAVEDIIDRIGSDEQDYYSPPNNMSDLIEVIPFVSEHWYGITQSVVMKNDTLVSDNIDSTSSVVFNERLFYTIYIMDKNLQFTSESPDVIPRTVLSWKQRMGTVILYLKVIRHEKLHRTKRPCDPSPEYNLASCIEKRIMNRIGCQPPWRRFSVDVLPLCDNWTLLSDFHHLHGELSVMGGIELSEVTGCHVPCTFFEYKV